MYDLGKVREGASVCVCASGYRFVVDVCILTTQKVVKR